MEHVLLILFFTIIPWLLVYRLLIHYAIIPLKEIFYNLF